MSGESNIVTTQTQTPHGPTHECTLCPSSFTRKTHLTRHLRSAHLQQWQRMYSCVLCGGRAAFARRDLLTRHVRRCEGSGDGGGTLRRKACEACVRRKVKCDLVRPCARCTARAEECVYAGRRAGSSGGVPATSRSGSGPGSSIAASDAVAGVAGLTSSDHTRGLDLDLGLILEPVTVLDSVSPPPAERACAIPRGSNASDPPRAMTPTSGLSTEHEDASDPVLSEVAVAVSGFMSSDIALDLDLDLDAMFREEIPGFVSAPGDVISAPQSSLSSGPAPAENTTAHAQAVIPQSLSSFDFPRVDDVNGLSGQVTNHPYPVSSLNMEDLFSPFQLGGSDACGGGVASPPTVPGGYSLAQWSIPTIPRPLGHPGDSLSDADLIPEEDAYLSYFYSLHCRHYPFFHLPTWISGTAHPLLKRAMRVCGALYALEKHEPDRHAAEQYIFDHLQGGLRQQIFRAFANTPRNDVDLQVELCLALITMQNLGLFHQCSIERSISAAYHGMMVTMLKKSSIPAFVREWRPFVVDELDMDQVWRSWARFETAKRVMIICYLHDSLLPIFHNTPPLLGDDEFELRLPCDNKLWDASNAQLWAELFLRDASPSSTQPNPWLRLLGDPFHSRLVDILDLGSSMHTTSPLNPFASFVIIHSLLRAFHVAKRNDSQESPHTLHHALAQWYMDRVSASVMGNEVVQYNFTCIALPLYWLAQLLYAESPTNASVMGEIRFITVKRWLKDFWPLLHNEGDEVRVGAELAGVTSVGFAYVEPVRAGDGGLLSDSEDKGLLEWVPRPR